jgi:hypothetical protein
MIQSPTIHPEILRVINSKRKQLERIQEQAFEQMQATEERIIEAIAALAFYDPRDKRPGLEITSAATWSRTGIALG